MHTVLQEEAPKMCFEFVIGTRTVVSLKSEMFGAHFVIYALRER